MTEDALHGDPALTLGRELGPVLSYGSVVVDQASLSLDVQSRGDECLPDREDGEKSLGTDWLPSLDVGEADRSIHDDLAVVIGDDLKADFAKINRLLDASLYISEGLKDGGPGRHR
jgi:hypothetical protein